MVNMQIPRNRDCIVLFKGDAYHTEIAPSLVALGWIGGQGVKWADSSTDGFVVMESDGYYAGFMLYGSDETADKYTAMTRTQPVNRVGTVCAGGWLICTIAIERYTYASRQAGPLVEINYQESDRLLFSLRGYWTKEDEWTLSGDPRAPNNYYIGYVSQAPNADNNYYMTVQTSI